jgi:ABC-2 type transport system permease protein
VSWSVVARKDFQDAIRSRWLHGLTALFAVLVAGTVFAEQFIASGNQVQSNQLLGGLILKNLIVQSLVPLAALVIAYNAIVGERESGSLKLLLALPHRRAEVVAGKVIGRSAAFVAAIAVGFLVPTLALALGPLRLQFLTLLGYVFLTAVLGAAFVSIATGASAAVSSNIRAIGIAIALYFVFVPVWSAVQLPLSFFLSSSGTPGWFPLNGQETLRAFRLLNPTGSFDILASAYLGGTLFSGDARLEVGATAMLLGWIVLPPMIGLYIFERADL